MFIIVVDDSDLLVLRCLSLKLSLDFPCSSWNRPKSLYNWFNVIIFFIIVFNNYTEEYWDGHMSKFIYVQ